MLLVIIIGTPITMSQNKALVLDKEECIQRLNGYMLHYTYGNPESWTEEEMNGFQAGYSALYNQCEELLSQ